MYKFFRGFSEVFDATARGTNLAFSIPDGGGGEQQVLTDQSVIKTLLGRATQSITFFVTFDIVSSFVFGTTGNAANIGAAKSHVVPKCSAMGHHSTWSKCSRTSRNDASHFSPRSLRRLFLLHRIRVSKTMKRARSACATTDHRQGASVTGVQELLRGRLQVCEKDLDKLSEKRRGFVRSVVHPSHACAEVNELTHDTPRDEICA